MLVRLGNLEASVQKERRRSARTYVCKEAQILATDSHRALGCTVRDLSAGGACLEVEDGTATRQFLDLSFDWFRSSRRCEVKWRSAGKIGVAFI
jgi:hypothetical protein